MRRGTARDVCAHESVVREIVRVHSLCDALPPLFSSAALRLFCAGVYSTPPSAFSEEEGTSGMHVRPGKVHYTVCGMRKTMMQKRRKVQHDACKNLVYPRRRPTLLFVGVLTQE